MQGWERKYNEKRPLSLVWERDDAEGGEKTYDLWIGGKIGHDKILENSTKVVMHCTDYEPKSFVYRKCKVLANCDINAIVDGRLDSMAFRDASLAFDRHATAFGSDMMSCLQGANRSGLVVVGFIMAKCRVSAQVALDFLRGLRPIVDISEGPQGSAALPMDFLAAHEHMLWKMFPNAGVSQWRLPVCDWPEVFISMCKEDWSIVPEYVQDYARPGTEASGQVTVIPPVAWLSGPVSPKRSVPKNTGSVDGDNAALAEAAAAVPVTVSDDGRIQVAAATVSDEGRVDLEPSPESARWSEMVCEGEASKVEERASASEYETYSPSPSAIPPPAKKQSLQVQDPKEEEYKQRTIQLSEQLERLKGDYDEVKNQNSTVLDENQKLTQSLQRVSLGASGVGRPLAGSVMPVEGEGGGDGGSMAAS